MKKVLVILFVCLTVFVNPNAAQTTSTADVGIIPVTAFVPKQTEAIPPTAQKAFENKINQMVSANGMGCLSNSRFAIIPKITIVDKQVQASVPPMIVMNMDITYYFGDVETGNVFGNVTKSYKGIGQNDTKAYMSAISNVKTKDPEIVELLEVGKQKVIDYYEKMSDQIIKSAMTTADMGDYNAAIFALMQIPEVCPSYSKALDAATAIFQKKIDQEGAKLYNEAYTLWSSQQNYEGAEQACTILAKIDPLCSSASKAVALSDNIAKRVREIDKREWDFVLKQEQHEVDLQKAVINATKEVAKAEASRPVYNYNVVWW